MLEDNKILDNVCSNMGGNNQRERKYKHVCVLLMITHQVIVIDKSLSSTIY